MHTRRLTTAVAAVAVAGSLVTLAWAMPAQIHSTLLLAAVVFAYGSLIYRLMRHPSDRLRHLSSMAPQSFFMLLVCCMAAAFEVQASVYMSEALRRLSLMLQAFAVALALADVIRVAYKPSEGFRLGLFPILLLVLGPGPLLYTVHTWISGPDMLSAFRPHEFAGGAVELYCVILVLPILLGCVALIDVIERRGRNRINRLSRR